MTWLRIFKRNEWGARYGTGWGNHGLPVDEAWLHHSDTVAPPENATFEQDAASVRYLDQIGYERFRSSDAGFKRPEGAGISYTWAVPPSGRVFEGHDPKRNSSHTYGRNGISVGIVLIGNFETGTPTKKQLEAVARLLLQAKDDGIIRNARLNGGHRDVVQTACPGRNLYSRIGEINRMVETIRNGGKEVPTDPNKGFTAAYIKEVQTILKTIGFYTGAITGKLLDVDDAVRAFQGANGLVVDGEPGNNTMTVARKRLAEYEARIAREKAAEEARKAEEKRIAGIVAASRISGSNRWATANAMALAKLPSGKGMLIAADGSPDERYATARANENVRYAPVQSGNDTPRKDTIAAVRDFKPAWVRFVGGSNVVTDKCARAVLEAAGLL